MGISFCAAEFDPNKNAARWIEGLEHLDLDLSQDNAAWVLSLIGRRLHPDYSGIIELDEVATLISSLETTDGVYEPFAIKCEGEPLIVECGRSQGQVDRYAEAFSELREAVLDRDGGLIIYG